MYKKHYFALGIFVYLAIIFGSINIRAENDKLVYVPNSVAKSIIKLPEIMNINSQDDPYNESYKEVWYNIKNNKRLTSYKVVYSAVKNALSIIKASEDRNEKLEVINQDLEHYENYLKNNSDKELDEANDAIEEKLTRNGCSVCSNDCPENTCPCPDECPSVCPCPQDSCSKDCPEVCSSDCPCPEECSSDCPQSCPCPCPEPCECPEPCPCLVD